MKTRLPRRDRDTASLVERYPEIYEVEPRAWWDDGSWPFVLQWVAIALSTGLAIGICNRVSQP